MWLLIMLVITTFLGLLERSGHLVLINQVCRMNGLIFPDAKHDKEGLGISFWGRKNKKQTKKIRLLISWDRIHLSFLILPSTQHKRVPMRNKLPGSYQTKQHSCDIGISDSQHMHLALVLLRSLVKALMMG